MAKLNAYHLASTRTGMSGRAIKMRQLSPSQLIEVSTVAGNLMSKDSKPTDYRAAVVAEGVKRSLAGYTEPIDPKVFGDAAELAKAQWTNLSPGDFEEDDAKLDKVFTARDYQMIVSLYSRNHEVGQDEVDDIAGKAVAISAS
jgi:hypothetical protein